MHVFKFNVGARSIERAVADAIGQGLAARQVHDEGPSQRFAELIARLDNVHREQCHDLALLQSGKMPKD